MKWVELEAEQKRALAYKVEMARGVLGQAFERAERPALAFSGGKDSTVLLDLVRRFFPGEIRRLQRALRSAPQLTLFDQFTTEELIEAQPCVFDDLDGIGGHPAHDGLAYDPEVE